MSQDTPTRKVEMVEQVDAVTGERVFRQDTPTPPAPTFTAEEFKSRAASYADPRMSDYNSRTAAMLTYAASLAQHVNSISHHSDCRCLECAPAKPPTEAP